MIMILIPYHMRDPLAPLPWQIDNPLLDLPACTQDIHLFCLFLFLSVLFGKMCCRFSSIISGTIVRYNWYHDMMLDKQFGLLILEWNQVKTFAIHKNGCEPKTHWHCLIGLFTNFLFAFGLEQIDWPPKPCMEPIGDPLPS